MADIVYNKAFERIAAGSFNLGSSAIKVALLGAGYTPNKDHDTWAQISANEVSGTGYTAGGTTLNGKSVSEDDSSDIVRFSASSVEWPSSSITARYAVIYDSTTGYLVACFDFGAARVSYNGTFRVDWNANGIMTFAQA